LITQVSDHLYKLLVDAVDVTVCVDVMMPTFADSGSAVEFKDQLLSKVGKAKVRVNTF